jgi:hypothetical protein
MIFDHFPTKTGGYIQALRIALASKSRRAYHEQSAGSDILINWATSRLWPPFPGSRVSSINAVGQQPGARLQTQEGENNL